MLISTKINGNKIVPLKLPFLTKITKKADLSQCLKSEILVKIEQKWIIIRQKFNLELENYYWYLFS